VEAGTTKDEQFAADLAQVVNQTAPKVYADPAVFFRHSYPTRGMKELLKAVLTRLSGRGGEIASIIRLHTQCGGGKTHALIALAHVVRGVTGVEKIEEFLDPALLPRGPVRVAALDGENSDPADGLTPSADYEPRPSGVSWPIGWPGRKAIGAFRRATKTTLPRARRQFENCSAANLP